MMTSTETTGMNDPLLASDGSELGPVSPSRKLFADRVSKHAAGRAKPMSKRDKAKLKRDRVRSGIEKALDDKALKEAAGG